MENTMKKTFDEKMNDKPLNELINEWKTNTEDEFGQCIHEICKYTDNLFKTEERYYTNPMTAFLWFYGFDKDRKKTYNKIISYIEATPRIKYWNTYNWTMIFTNLNVMKGLIENDKKEQV